MATAAASTASTASTASPSKKSVRSRRNRRNGGSGGTKKPLSTSGEEVRGSSEASAVVKEGIEDLDGACALAPQGVGAKGGVVYDQRVPDINLSNLEDFLEAVEASTDEEKEEPDEPNIAEGAGAMFDSLPKVQAETPKKGRSRHAVDNLIIYNFLKKTLSSFSSCSPDPMTTSETMNLNSQNISYKFGYYLNFFK